MKLPYFKKCGGFFFLFFLHGTSIRNGQQGISCNSHIDAINTKLCPKYILYLFQFFKKTTGVAA